MTPLLETPEIQEKSNYDCWVVFLISAPELQPELITRLLDLEPDRSRSPGPDLDGEWQLSSKLNASSSINEHLLHLLGMLLPLRHKLREFRRDARLEFYCSVERKGEAPVIEISPRLQLLCGHIGAVLRIEVEAPIFSPGTSS